MRFISMTQQSERCQCGFWWWRGRFLKFYININIVTCCIFYLSFWDLLAFLALLKNRLWTSRSVIREKSIFVFLSSGCQRLRQHFQERQYRVGFWIKVVKNAHFLAPVSNWRRGCSNMSRRSTQEHAISLCRNLSNGWVPLWQLEWVGI